MQDRDDNPYYAEWPPIVPNADLIIGDGEATAAQEYWPSLDPVSRTSASKLAQAPQYEVDLDGTARRQKAPDT